MKATAKQIAQAANDYLTETWMQNKIEKYAEYFNEPCRECLPPDDTTGHHGEICDQCQDKYARQVIHDMSVRRQLKVVADANGEQWLEPRSENIR